MKVDYPRTRLFNLTETVNSEEEFQTNQFRLFIFVATQRSSLLGGLKVAIIVGAVVNLINQGDHLLGLQFVQVSWPKLLVTFCIPFLVSIYNGTTTRLRFDPGVRAFVNARLACRTCKHEMDVNRDEIIPDCSHCGLGSQWKRQN